MSRIRRVPVAVVLLASLLPLSPARAEPVCELSNGPGTFGVLEWTNTGTDGTFYLAYSGRDVFERSDGDNYQMVGLFVIDASTARTVAVAFATFYDSSSWVYAEVLGQVLVDQRVPFTGEVPVGSGNGMTGIPGSLPAGTYHIVGISAGGGDGVGIEGLNDRTEGITSARASGLWDCTTVQRNAELVHLDEEDFSGTQVSVPGAGYRNGATATYLNERRYLVGALQHSAHGAGRRAGQDTSYSRLHIDTPTGAGWLARDIAPISSTGGSYRFTSQQLGASARVNINALAYDIG